MVSEGLQSYFNVLRRKNIPDYDQIKAREAKLADKAARTGFKTVNKNMYASASLSPKEQQQKFKLTLSCACQPIMTRQQCVDSHVEQRYGSTKNNLEDYITCPVHNQVVKVLGHTPHFDSNWMGNVAGRLRSARLQKAAAVEEHNRNNE